MPRAPGDAWPRPSTARARARPTKRRDTPARRLHKLGATIGLAKLDVAILEVLLYYETEPLVEDLIDAVFARRRHVQPLNTRSDCLPRVLGVPALLVKQRLRPGAPLLQAGLVTVDDDQDLAISSRLRRLAAVGPANADVRELLLGATRSSDLVWSDFDHLGQRRDDIAMLLNGALKRSAPGVNILVYGPPGTGKTEFCHVLAAKLGVRLFSVGETDDYGGEPSRRERLQELNLAQSLLTGDTGAVVLFDEMDDLLAEPPSFAPFLFHPMARRRGSRSAGSKVFMNRLLEEAPTPTLWITNDASTVNPAILRRMRYALEMRQPPPRIRTRIWSRQLAAHGIEASADDARTLAYEFDATPGVAAGATAAADLGGGGFDLVRRSVGTLSRALGCNKLSPPSQVDFDPEFAVADIDLGTLAEQIANADSKRISLCLQGPPGTGKSAFARYLADQLGMEVLEKRGSDLLDKYVGGTEANIAAAFAEAQDEHAFLIFDEADSLLGDRQRAHRQWEISQVNEMLTWMESHPLPFACTTNYAEHLDSATLRRFLFKAAFRFLTPALVAKAFRSWFDLEAPRSACQLANVTPGDFDVVARKARVLGNLDDADALARLLKAECEAKPGQASALGFAA